MRSVLPLGRTLRGWWLARVAASLIYRKACGHSVRLWGSCNDDASRVRTSAVLSCGKARAPKFSLQATRFGVASNLSCVISRFWRTFMTRRWSPNGFRPPLSCAFSDRYSRSGGLRAVFHRASRRENRLSRTYVRYSNASRHRGACRSPFRAVKHDAAVMLRDLERRSLSGGTAAPRNGGGTV